MGNSIKSHYLPKSYLNGFASGQGEAEKTFLIFRYERGAAEPKELATSVVSKIKDYYCDESVDGNKDQSLENRLAKIDANIEIGKKMVSGERIGELEKKSFAEYLSLFETRVPAFEGFAEFTEKSLKPNAPFLVENKDFIRQIRQTVKEIDGIECSEDETKENYIKSVNESKLSGKKLHLDNLQRIASVLKEMILRMNWAIYKVPVGCHFITSDEPILTINNKCEPNADLNDPRICLTFPLNKECCFVAGKTIAPVVMRVDDNFVYNMNYCRSYFLKPQYVYASKKDGQISEWMKQVDN